jgi:glycosyltransferase involved in cell wall biosynthesis
VERECFAVSVAIPAFNEATRIGKTIAIIRAQTEPPAEIIVVDDGSRDATADIARSLGVRVLEQVNAGVAAARNRAIREATSPWIAFCDADDLWHPEKLAASRLACEARPGVGFLFTDYSVESGARVRTPSTFSVTPEFAANVCERIDGGISFFEGPALARALAQCNFIGASTVLVRRALLLERSIFFDVALARNEDFYVAEDFEWYLRLLKATDALAVERVLAVYRRHSGSLSEDSGRIRHGDLMLGELIANAPERYVDGLAAVFAAQRRRHLCDSARYYGRALRFGKMRAQLREAQRLEFRVGDELLWVLSGAAALPGGAQIAGALSSAWLRVLKPALRRTRRAR